MSGILMAFFQTTGAGVVVVTINTVVTGLSDAPMGIAGFCG